MVDSDPSPGRFILAGSVEPATSGPTYPSTGRVGRLLMRPMTALELDGHGSERTLLERVVAGDRPQASAGRRADRGSISSPVGIPAARSLSDASLLLDG